MEDKIFCENCGQRIIKGNLLKKGMKFYEFIEGYYCENCAKIKIEEARKKQKEG